jgi:hypothetical protein
MLIVSAPNRASIRRALYRTSRTGEFRNSFEPEMAIDLLAKGQIIA